MRSEAWAGTSRMSCGSLVPFETSEGVWVFVVHQSEAIGSFSTVGDFIKFRFLEDHACPSEEMACKGQSRGRETSRKPLQLSRE